MVPVVYAKIMGDLERGRDVIGWRTPQAITVGSPPLKERTPPKSSVKRLTLRLGGARSLRGGDPTMITRGVLHPITSATARSFMVCAASFTSELVELYTRVIGHVLDTV